MKIFLITWCFLDDESIWCSQRRIWSKSVAQRFHKEIPLIFGGKTNFRAANNLIRCFGGKTNVWAENNLIRCFDGKKSSRLTDNRNELSRCVFTNFSKVGFLKKNANRQNNLIRSYYGNNQVAKQSTEMNFLYYLPRCVFTNFLKVGFLKKALIVEVCGMIRRT